MPYSSSPHFRGFKKECGTDQSKPRGKNLKTPCLIPDRDQKQGAAPRTRNSMGPVHKEPVKRAHGRRSYRLYSEISCSLQSFDSAAGTPRLSHILSISVTHPKSRSHEEVTSGRYPAHACYSPGDYPCVSLSAISGPHQGSRSAGVSVHPGPYGPGSPRSDLIPFSFPAVQDTVAMCSMPPANLLPMIPPHPGKQPDSNSLPAKSESHNNNPGASLYPCRAIGNARHGHFLASFKPASRLRPNPRFSNVSHHRRPGFQHARASLTRRRKRSGS